MITKNRNIDMQRRKDELTRWVIFEASEFCSQKPSIAEIYRTVDYLLDSESKDILLIRKRLIKAYPDKLTNEIKEIEKLLNKL